MKSGAKRAKTKSNIPSFQDWYNKNMKTASQAETNINTVMEDRDEIDLTKSGSSTESKSNPEDEQQEQIETGQSSPLSTSPFSGSGPEDEDCNGNIRTKRKSTNKQKGASIGIVNQEDDNEEIEKHINGKEEDLDYNETVKIMKTKTKQASIRSMFASQLTPNSPNNSFIQLAEILIHLTISQQPMVETLTMYVPFRAVWRIIGRV